jgi:hypothetical protein
MKPAWPLLVVSLLSVGALDKAGSQPAPSQATAADASREPVIVELFTSEGCSSCPPAEALLRRLETDQPIEGAEVIALEEHVDYWNHDGWTDSYSAAEWTVRQQEYVARFKGDGPYTPQMIVDGQRQFTGSNERDAREAIGAAAHKTRIEVSIQPGSPTKSDSQRFEVRVGNVPGTESGNTADAWIAVTEDHLETPVHGGENKGMTLQHAAVVRTLHKIGEAPANGRPPLVDEAQVKFKSNWKRENLRVVVFVQDRKSLRVFGAASTKLAS